MTETIPRQRQYVETMQPEIAEEQSPTIEEIIEYMSQGGEINLGHVNDNEVVSDKPKSYIDYEKVVNVIMDSIRLQAGQVDELFDSEISEFLMVASLSANIVLQMNEEDAIKAIKVWHPWQKQTYQILEQSHRVTSVAVTIKQSDEETSTPAKAELASAI